MSNLIISDLQSTQRQQIDDDRLTPEEQALVQGGELFFCPSPGQSFGSYLNNWMNAGTLSGAGVGFYSGGLPGLAIGAGLGLGGGVALGLGGWLICKQVSE